MTVLSERALRAEPRLRRLSFAHPVSVAALFIDLGALVLSALVAMWGRESTWLFSRGAELGATLGMVGPLAVLGWIGAIYLTGGYRRDVFVAGSDEYKRVAHASLYAAALLGIGCYLTRFPLARGFFLLLFVVGVPCLLVGRALLRTVLHAVHRRGGLTQRVLISGGPAHVDEIAGVLRREPWLGYKVAGALTPATHLDPETPGGIPVLGNVDDLAVAAAQDVDVVFFAGGANMSASQMRRSVWELEGHNVQTVVAPSVSEVSGDRITLRPVGGLPLVHIDPPTWHQASRLGKRSFDIVGSALLIIAFAPVLTAAALWVRLSDGGPAIFRQARIGREGQVFDCLKFRSMCVDAEARLLALHESQGYDGNGLFKMREDPRITRPGRWLRRFSIDELPQLFNVLRGDMSLVGPRPPLPLEVQGYDEDVARRLRVRPGMTGLWQVSGRSDLTFSEAVRLDLFYVDNWSMVQDLSILARTLGAVVGSRGAY